jgi:hypothetical protein
MSSCSIDFAAFSLVMNISLLTHVWFMHRVHAKTHVFTCGDSMTKLAPAMNKVKKRVDSFPHFFVLNTSSANETKTEMNYQCICCLHGAGRNDFGAGKSITRG